MLFSIGGAQRTAGSKSAGQPISQTVGRVSKRRDFSGASMIVKYVLPLVALALLVFAVQYVIKSRPVEQEVPPPIQPARSPFAKTLAGSGVVEAETENIAVGSTSPGLVTEVFVKVNDRVKPGDPLFKLDDRQLLADLAVRKAALASANAETVRLASQPRKESLPIYQAAVDEARANAADMLDELRRAEELNSGGRRVLTEQEFSKRRHALEMSKARLRKSEADYELQRAGAWSYDRDVAEAAVQQADAQVKAVEEDIRRTTVTAFVTGRVLQVNVRPGEYVATPSSIPLLVLGNIDQLHVRVDIDEHDIPRFTPGTAAWATLKGNAGEKYPLKFVRVEPYVVPKKSLTGQNTERVDTRVLQVIYELEPKDRPVFVGQQVEVFIDAKDSKASNDASETKT